MTEEQKPGAAMKLPPIPIFAGYPLTARQRGFATAVCALAAILLRQMGAPPPLAAALRDSLLAPFHAGQPVMDEATQAASQAYMEAILAWYKECARLAPKIIPPSAAKLRVVP